MMWRDREFAAIAGMRGRMERMIGRGIAGLEKGQRVMWRLRGFVRIVERDRMESWKDLEIAGPEMSRQRYLEIVVAATSDCLQP